MRKVYQKFIRVYPAHPVYPESKRREAPERKLMEGNEVSVPRLVEEVRTYYSSFAM